MRPAAAAPDGQLRPDRHSDGNGFDAHDFHEKRCYSADGLPPTLSRCDSVRTYILPPAIAGVLRLSSFSSVRPSSLNSLSAATQTTVPAVSMAKILSPART